MHAVGWTMRRARVGQEVVFPCHVAEIAAADRWGAAGVHFEVSNGERGARRGDNRPTPRLSPSPHLTNLARENHRPAPLRQLGFDDDEGAADVGAVRRRRDPDGAAEGDRSVVPDGEGAQPRVGGGAGQAARGGDPQMLPQLRPSAGDGGAALGDARGGVADPRAEGEVEGVPLPPLSLIQPRAPPPMQPQVSPQAVVMGIPSPGSRWLPIEMEEDEVLAVTPRRRTRTPATPTMLPRRSPRFPRRSPRLLALSRRQ